MQRKGFQIRIWQWGLLAAIFVFWWALTKPGFIPAFFFSDDSQAAFFFGEPVIILQRIWEWFAGGEIYIGNIGWRKCRNASNAMLAGLPVRCVIAAGVLWRSIVRSGYNPGLLR